MRSSELIVLSKDGRKRAALRWSERPALAYAAAAAIAVLAVVLRVGATAYLVGAQFITFFPAVVVSAYLFGIRPGLLTAVLCGLAGWFLLIEPELSFRIDAASDAITLSMYFVTASAIAVLVGGAREAALRERAAKEALRDSGATLRNVVEQMPVGVIIARTPSGEILVWNKASERMLGHPVLGASAEEYGSYGGVHEDGSAFAATDYPMARAVLFGEAVRDRELRYRRGDGTLAHLSVSATPVRSVGGASDLAVCTFVDITGRKRAEEHQQLLINELNHRVKNTLATVQSISNQTLRNASSTAQARQALESRLLALSRAHDVLTRENWEGADLKEIVGQAMAPYGTGDASRIELCGASVRLKPAMALALAMSLQELATNAAKYGALSDAGGRVRIEWRGGDGRLRLIWTEAGGPPVEPSTRRGFGTRLIERSLASELDGTATIAFEPAGVVCTLDVPL
ncbi:MAG TPA: HWE histidine kinase domain-containing protein [Microvirga sp.]|jgi:PAS domain S-box-containing protein|nr:HWE histidine kinase domain-containing protein [Microvirga sp.]